MDPESRLPLALFGLLALAAMLGFATLLPDADAPRPAPVPPGGGLPPSPLAVGPALSEVPGDTAEPAEPPSAYVAPPPQRLGAPPPAPSTRTALKRPPRVAIRGVVDTAVPVVSVWPATPQGIESAVKESLPQIRECYQGWLAETPGLEGRVVVELTLSEDDQGVGAITDAHAAQGTDHPPFDACIANVLGGLEFDAPADGALVIRYPLLFSTD